MRNRRRVFHRLLAGLAIAMALAGGERARATQILPGPPQPTPAAAAPDALGRSSPFGTVTGFSRAVTQGDLTLAAKYLQLRGRQVANAPELATSLNELLERYYTHPLTRISSEPAGDLRDGLEPQYEQLPLLAGSETYLVRLERVTDPDAGQVWLFSTQTLNDVPKLAATAQATWLERSMPAGLLDRSVMGASLAQWLAWALSIVVPLLLFWIIARVGIALTAQLTSDPARRITLEAWSHRLRWPIVAGLTLAVHIFSMPSFGFGLESRFNYARTVVAVIVVILGIFVWRLVSLAFRQAATVALRRGRADTRTLLLLIERVTKVLVALVALFALLSVAGLDLTTALAGVGIIGVAVAFGFQKTVENLLGGVFLLTDKVLAIGDYCRVSDREGWIEDITLRSVRLRTLEQTLLSVPAGVLSQGNIENYSTRGKMLIQSRLRLRYGASVSQLQGVLTGIRQLMASDPRLEQPSARVRLVDFGPNAIEVELFAFAQTGDALAFLEIREHVLLRVAAVVESAGCAFAAPAQFMYDVPAVRTNAPEPTAVR